MDAEVKEFIKGIGANEPEPTSDSYALFRSLFKRQNYFRLKDRFLIVKISRTSPPFWGVGKKFIDFFKTVDIDYFLVLLVSDREGWVFDKHDVDYNIERGYWKLRQKDNNYKINPPLKDKNSFSTHKQFLRKIGLESE
jgi:hypothetical protein